MSRVAGRHWPAPRHWAGRGLPQLLDAALQEMLYASNHAWAMYTGIAHGAYLCLKTHAAPWLQARYLPDIVSGQALPTMCLTESQAGSDVGLLRCRAEPQADGSYRLSGSKLFISGGEHDLTVNILHLVLARLPRCAAGQSWHFTVPGAQATRRWPGPMACGAMASNTRWGSRAAATCSLVFDAAQGWLVGDANRGLAAMFVMMNSARLHVGLQGLGHVEAAWQNARQYAAERVQMRGAVKAARSGGPGR